MVMINKDTGLYPQFQLEGKLFKNFFSKKLHVLRFIFIASHFYCLLLYAWQKKSSVLII